jgi:GTPase SAR1 family protein
MTKYSQADTLARLSTAFTPHQPISTPDFLSGRKDLLYSIIDAVNTEGLHIILYGDRGTGKTSIIRVLSKWLDKTSDKQDKYCITISGSTNDTYTTLWRKATQEILLSKQQIGFAQHQTAMITDRIDAGDTLKNPNDVRLFWQSLTGLTVIIIDEFDKISIHSDVRGLMADTIKLFSDYNVQVKLVIVGVGENIDELFKEHQSISRNIAQIKVEPMTVTELSQIIQNGYGFAGVTYEKGLDVKIATISQGYPHYTHLLGLWSGRQAVENNEYEITSEHLHLAIPRALKNAEGGLQHQYEKAIVSSRKDALFTQVLLACAMAEKDSLGRFSTRAVQPPIKNITGIDYISGAYQGHLSKFCEEDRGKVLVRTGKKKSYRWKFTNPQLIPYVLLKGISDKLITEI